ncbi:MAG: HAD-IB family hydrolase [Mobiluncus sp.]|uniref:HAD-IB family hydrolase n=1 Tax=Mobiluncus porci TaxID=2652278 RepID=A0A7K0K2L0_9ACTO|nr:HAD-IB family hydrolase [Mobiluncus sp.]MCI6585497.1 HAD-IB family hydrolase [Mobiluncus sp.]MST49659.1 HAD-IB family hydrolase [Mobiluncus porci]
MAKTAAFFDIDGTLIRGASTWYLARDLYQRGYFGLDFFFFAAWQSLLYVVFGENKKRIERIKQRSLRILKGKLESDLALIGEELYDHFLQERLFPGTLRIIEKHQKAGHEVWLVSATPQEISKQMAHRLNLTGGLGTIVEVDDNGRYTGRMPQSLLHGTMKAKAVLELAEERGLDLSTCFAYSDSLSDEKMFNLVGHPCAVNPEWKLRRIAKQRNWPIYDFAFRRPSVALAARTTLLPATIVGGVWTAKVLWRHVLRRLFKLPVRLLRKLFGH